MTHYVEIINKIYQQNGIKGFYRGYWATFWRDVPSYGAFFFIYEYIKRYLIKKDESLKTAYPK
jgi:hypothetical protein